MWHRIDRLDSIPAQQDLRLAVVDAQGAVHALTFPCRRSGRDWLDAHSGRRVEVCPTHWQEWDQS